MGEIYQSLKSSFEQCLVSIMITCVKLCLEIIRVAYM